MDIKETYKNFCQRKGILFRTNESVSPFDDTTLFCPAGMQQFKPLFKDFTYKGTQANIQSCIRMKDIKEIGDSTHLLYFNMMGLFSFRELSVKQTIDMWMEFLTNDLDLKPDYVTIHPDRKEWKSFYDEHEVEVRESEECKWSDGEIGGYCTEFFINDVEIGNIVNPLGDCIDVGFGLERLEMFVNGKILNKEQTLKDAIKKIMDSGYSPSNTNQGYVLKRLLRQLEKTGSGTIL